MGTKRITGLDTTSESSVDYEDMAPYNDTSLYTDTYQVQSAGSTTELTYKMDWNSWNGYYMTIPEVGAMVDRKAWWCCGRGWTSPEGRTEKILKEIRGNGKDTFTTIMINAVKVYTIGGDFFAEIIRKGKKIINLKPMNPGTVEVVADEKGMIKKYVQTPEGISKTVTFKPEDIFHLAWNRQADAIHGTPTLEKLKWTIQAIREAKRDNRVLFHRYVKPIMIIPVDTDDATEVAAFKAKYDTAYQKAETIVVPKETVDVENIKSISIPQFSTLDPQPWIKRLEEDFIKAEGVASVILGVADKEMTEASGKILYLSYQQVIETNQLFIEEQIMAQLEMEVKFNFPASIEPELQKDEAKDGELNKKPNVTPAKPE